MRVQEIVKNYFNYTRSEITKLQNEGKILVNGKKENLSYVLLDSDIVSVDGVECEKVSYKYYLYNKPIGLICTNDKNNKNGIMSTLNINSRLYTIGRLDKDSTGLIILTNDGKFTHKILDPNNHIEKEYLVKCEKQIDNEFISNIQKPILIDKKYTKECSARLIDNYSFNIVLKEGMNRQIRKMVKSLGNKVIYLKRVRIGRIKLEDYNIREGELLELSNIKENI